MERFDHNIAALLDHFGDTTIGYGSEFRTPHHLNKIFGGHPNFAFFRNTLENGMGYLFTSKISNAQRLLEVQANLKRGNHKSSTSMPDVTAKELAKDVCHGFSLPLPVDTIPHLQGALVQLCGITSQYALLSDGS